MKNLINKPVVVRVDGENVKGTLLRDFPDRVIVQSEKDGKQLYVTIVKNKISMFVSNGDTQLPPVEKPAEKPAEKVVEKAVAKAISECPTVVYACQNETTGCTGVKYLRVDMKEGEGMNAMDFMSPCPCLSKECKSGCLGDLKDLKSEMISDMLDRLMLGNYPEPKKKRGRPRKNAEGTEEPTAG